MSDRPSLSNLNPYPEDAVRVPPGGTRRPVTRQPVLPLNRIEAILKSDGMAEEPVEWIAALLALVEIARAAQATAHEYTLCSEGADDGEFALWSEDRLISSIVALRASLARLDQEPVDA